MSILTFAITLIVIGVLLWLVNEYIPMDPKIKRILNIAVVVAVVIWVCYVFGLFDRLDAIRVGSKA